MKDRLLALAVLGEAEKLANHNDLIASLAYNTMVYLRYRTRYGIAEPLLQRPLAIYEKIRGGDYPSTAITLGILAHLYQLQGRYTEAESLLPWLTLANGVVGWKSI